MIPSTYDLHYVEYDDTVGKLTSSDWIDPSKTNLSGTNLIYAKKYEKEAFMLKNGYGMDFANIYSLVNPEVGATAKKRYFSLLFGRD